MGGSDGGGKRQTGNGEEEKEEKASGKFIFSFSLLAFFSNGNLGNGMAEEKERSRSGGGTTQRSWRPPRRTTLFLAAPT